MALVARRQTVVFISLLVALVAGCNLKPRDVWVYIDNAGARPLAVSVDGQFAANVAPGDVAKLVYPPGEHKFQITSGEEVVCDLTKNLEPSDKVAACRKYLFNPDKLNRYQTYQVKYGGSRLDGVMQASLLKYQTDPQLKRNYIYKQLLKEVKPLSGDAWNDVTSIDYILTPPPDHMISKGTVRRTVLWRVEPKLHERLTQMTKIAMPSDHDIDSLNELLDEILADAP